MKQSSARPAGKLHAATRRWDNPRGKLLDLDDDILLPADPSAVARQPAPVSAPRVDGSSTAAKTARSEAAGAGPRLSRADVDAGARTSRIQTPAPDTSAATIEPHRLKALLAAAERATRLEKTIGEQSQKLSSCHDQILELSTTRDQQAAALNSARDSIGGLEQSLRALREAAGKRDAELAATVEKLNASEKDRLALQGQIHAAHRDYMQVSDRLLVSETALNDQNAVAAALQETIDRSNAEHEQLKFQNAALEAEIESAKQQRRELDEQTANFRREIEAIKASSQQSLRQAETLAKDRAALQQRCEELLRTVGLLQAARRKMSSELQADVGDLGQLHMALSEMKSSHDAITGKFEQAETKLGKMRQRIEELEKSHAILAKYDTALVEAAPKTGSDPELARQHLKSKNKLFELLETYFKDRRDTNHEVVSNQKVLETNDPVQTERQDPIQEEQPSDTPQNKIPAAEFAEWPLMPHEQGADIIKLETTIRGKKVA